MSRRVALMPVPLAAPFGRMQTAPLPSQKTWMDMIKRLEAKYGPQAKRTKTKTRRKKKRVKTVKKKRPSKKAQRAFRPNCEVWSSAGRASAWTRPCVDWCKPSPRLITP